jgi:ketosteroid isomerase-like protein
MFMGRMPSVGRNRSTEDIEVRHSNMTVAVARGALTCRALLLAFVLGACGTAGSESADAGLEQMLKQRIEDAYDFSRPGAVARMVALYPASGPVVSAGGGQVVASTEELRQGIMDFWDNVGRNMREPRWEWGEVHVQRLGRDAAVLTGTWSIPHIAPMGRPHVIGGAWTAVFRRMGGEWLIVHEHLSTPE